MIEVSDMAFDGIPLRYYPIASESDMKWPKIEGESEMSELEDLRATVNRLHRRCQRAESALNEALSDKEHGPSVGRGLLAWRCEKLEVENAELIGIVRELAGMEPYIVMDGSVWCRVCEGRSEGPAHPHLPDCLWLRAQKFKEKP